MQRQSRVVLYAFLLTVLLNAIAYPFLPDPVALQYGFRGFQQFAPRAVLVVLMPAVLGLFYVFSRGSQARLAAVAVALAAANALTVGLNLFVYRP